MVSRAYGKSKLGRPALVRTPEITLASILASLGALVYADGTLNGSNIRNFGSLGASADGTPTAITIDGNGMNFNGATDGTSLISIANHASLNALTDFCYLFWLKPNASGGEGSSPRLWNWGNSAHVCFHSEASAALGILVDYSGTDSSVTTANNFVSQGVEQMLFIQHRASDKLSRAYKGIGGAVAEATYSGTPTAGTGDITARPDALIIGNRLAADSTFADYIKAYAIFGRELTAGEMLQATLLAGLT